jgi:hypothetical protein
MGFSRRAVVFGVLQRVRQPQQDFVLPPPEQYLGEVDGQRDGV